MSILKKRISSFWWWVRRHRIKTSLAVFLLVAYYFCLPKELFTEPTSTVIESREGNLLGARIAEDGQWRFPASEEVPDKFAQCIVQYEDAYFYKHPGFNPVSIVKALATNLRAGHTLRGGSTLTQQVIRLSRKGKERTYFEKLIELILATRLEFRASKKDILGMYTSHAPFGGNVVGLDVAAWRYFGVLPDQLSWAESATLAVLPNAPGLIYPGKNQEALLKKRNALLEKLLHEKIIDSLTYDVSLAEPLPGKPYALPQTAPHLLQTVALKNPGLRTTTTIQVALQEQVNTIVKQHYELLRQNEVHNAAVLVMEVHTREILAYTGNTPTDVQHQKDVDIIQASRSTGSVLKPFLFTAMLDAGELLPTTLVADVPTQIAGYTPENFDETYDGAVPAQRALARSLNVPAVRLLKQYGLERFRENIKQLGIRSINKSADHYGLTLILGGAESSLWDLCKTYASLAATLNHYTETSGEYFTKEFSGPLFIKGNVIDFGPKTLDKTLFDAGSIYLTFEAMKEVNRPEGNESWEFFDSSKQIAWKTGTSFGNRDAWAIGVTKDYVVGVWVGNADGEGRPELTGVSSAAPILFDVFDVLPTSKWFAVPYDALTEIEICEDSGYLATDICPKKTTLAPINGKRFAACPYHRNIHLDTQRQYRVNTSCEDISDMITESWFVLPPLMEYYFKNTNATYKSLPPFKAGCLPDETPRMEFILPKDNGKIILTRDFDGSVKGMVLKLAHSKPETAVFWYLDDEFIGQTETFHEITIVPHEGKHRITAIDEFGFETYRILEVEMTR